MDWPLALLAERLALVINHLLVAEPLAQQRLGQHAGRVVTVLAVLPGLRGSLPGAGSQRPSEWRFLVTPAGLLEPLSPAGSDAAPLRDRDHLRVRIEWDRPLEVARLLLARQRPPIRIEGDAEFATDVGWLIDHLRWDVEEDLSRMLGDAPAHWVVSRARQVGGGLLTLLQRALPTASPDSGSQTKFR